jgi:transposase
MLTNMSDSGSMLHSAVRASKRSEKPAQRRRTIDRLRQDAPVNLTAELTGDVVAELDRRSPRIANPNSRRNEPVCRPSSHRQGRAAMTQHDSTQQGLSSLPVVGIDVSKKSLDIFIDTLEQRFTLDNNDQAIAALTQRLKASQVRLVVIEATGRYHRRVAATLLAADIATSVVNPQRAREFARAMGKLEKTDRIDAQMLAAFGRQLQPRPQQIQPENRTILADLVSRRRSLVQLRVAEKNRAHDDLPKLAAQQSKALLRLIEQQIEDLDREIASQIQADDDWHNKSQIIDSVPGIGANSANQLTVDLPELGHLNRQQISKLVGVAPLTRDSGTFKGQRSIRGGRHDVRVTLYMAAHNAVMYCPRFKAFFDQLIARGKRHKVAMTACMRKLLVTLNQMVKTKTHWNPQIAMEPT